MLRSTEIRRCSNWSNLETFVEMVPRYLLRSGLARVFIWKVINFLETFNWYSKPKKAQKFICKAYLESFRYSFGVGTTMNKMAEKWIQGELDSQLKDHPELKKKFQFPS